MKNHDITIAFAKPTPSGKKKNTATPTRASRTGTQNKSPGAPTKKTTTLVAKPAQAKKQPKMNATAQSARTTKPTHKSSAVKKNTVSDIPLVDIHTADKRHIMLLGTAHVSKQSVEDVRVVVARGVDVIAVELDSARYNKLTRQDLSFDQLDIFSVIKQKKAMLLLTSIVLSAFQRRIGAFMEVMPGAEMLAAAEEAKRLGIPCVLIDRAADVTLKRAWAKSSLWGKQKILVSLISMVFSKEEVSEEKLNEMKTMSLQGQIMEELSSFLPDLKRVLVDERDEYLAIKLVQDHELTDAAHAETSSVKKSAPRTKTKTRAETRILAVLGAAHVPGVHKHIERLSASNAEGNNLTDRIRNLEYVSAKKKFGWIKFVIPAVVIGLITWGFFKSGAEAGTQNILEWIFINGGLSFIGALIAWAHPLTMLVAFVAAPLTSINPMLGVGFITGMTEALLRKPRVQDIAELQTMKLSMHSFYKNKITRTLLVFLLTTLGSAAGTFIALPFLV